MMDVPKLVTVATVIPLAFQVIFSEVGLYVLNPEDTPDSLHLGLLFAEMRTGSLDSCVCTMSLSPAILAKPLP
jgi:hypothetical protein